MININDNIKNAYFSSTTQIDRIKIDNNYYYITNVEYSDNCYQDGNVFGTAEARQLEFQIENSVNVEGKEYEYQTGIDINGTINWISLGTFITYDVQEDDTNGITKVVAMDYMIKSNILYEHRDFTLGWTIKEILEDALEQCGLELGTDTFVNDDFVVHSDQFEDNALCRQVIIACAQISGTFAKIRSDNKLYLINPNKLIYGNLVDESSIDIVTEDDKIILLEQKIDTESGAITSGAELSLKDYENNTLKRNTHEINTLVLGMQNVEGENVVVQDEEMIEQDGTVNRIVINDNPFAYTQALRTQLINPIFNSIKGFCYTAFELKYQGLPFLECGDRVTITTINGNKIESYCFRYSFKSPNGLESTLQAPSLTDAEVQYENIENLDTRLKRTEIVVDKENQQIQAIVSEIGDRSEKQTTITQDIDSIESYIDENLDLTDSLTSYGGAVLQNCREGNLLELHIRGNNTIFTPLAPNNSLQPSNSLKPKASVLKVTHSNNTEETPVITYDYYDLGVTSPLKSSGDYYDEFVIKDGYAYELRRIGEGGVIIENPEPTNKREFAVLLTRGTNALTIQDEVTTMDVRWVLFNDITDYFTTKIDLSSTINQTRDSIMLSVNEKVDSDEIIASINLAVRDDKGIVSLVGNTLEWESDHSKLSADGVLELRGTTTEPFIPTLADVYKALNFLKNPSEYPLTPEEIQLYDFDNDGEVTIIDAVIMLNIIKGTRESDKYANAQIKLDPLNPNKFISISIAGTDRCTIGLNEIYSYRYRGEQMLIGQYAGSIGSLTPYGILLDAEQGKVNIDNQQDGSYTELSGEEISIYQKNSETKTVITDSSIDTGHVIAGDGILRGYCMHSPDLDKYPGTNHTYWCHMISGGSALTFTVDANAYTDFNATNWWIPNNSSDERLKHDIEPISEDLLKLIDELELKQFKYNTDNEHTAVGAIAQDFLALIEKYGLNKEEIDKYQIVRYGIDRSEENPDGFMALDYSRIQLLKVKCLENRVAKQDDIIKNLINRIEKLEKGEK